MNFQQGDIINHKKAVWISERLLVENCALTDDYIRRIRSNFRQSCRPCHRKAKTLPATGKSWRFMKHKGQFYYDLAYIPNRKPKYYQSVFGDAETLVQQYEDHFKQQKETAFETAFNHHLITNQMTFEQYYRDCTTAQRVGLARACAVLDFTTKYQAKNPDERASDIYKLVGSLVDKYQIPYFPKNYRRVQEKVELHRDHDEPITEIIKLPRKGVKTALKYDDPELKSWAIQLRMMGKNYSDAYIHRKLKDMCAQTGKKCPSIRWWGMNVFEDTKVRNLVASSRYGIDSNRAAIYDGYTPMKNALFAGDCWQIDATRFNLIAHKTDNGDKFLYGIAVRDVHSGDVLGYHFDYSENRWSVMTALKMAVENAGYLPYELVTDRFPGHNTPEWDRIFDTIEKLGTKVTITHQAKGKAKVERWFGTLQSVFMMDSEYYYGEGIKSTRASNHRSPEYLKEAKKKVRKSGWDLNSAYTESAEIVEAYRRAVLSSYSRKYQNVDSSPIELHENSDKPHVKQVNQAQISMIFGLKKTVRLTNSGQIKTEIQKIECYFRTDDYDIFTNHDRVILSYDLGDLSTAQIFEARNGLLVHLGAVSRFEAVQIYGPQAEHGRIAKEKQRIRQINEMKQAELEEMTAQGDEVALMMGRLTDKSAAEQNESLILQDQPMKKVANSDVYEDDDVEINPITVRDQY